MAEHIGLVIQTERTGLARVAADRKGACGGCDHRGGGCHGCLSEANRVESMAVNSVGAGVGDLVALKMTPSRLFSGVALLYLLPVLGLICGAFAGDWAIGPVGAIIGAFSGLGIGYGFLIAVGRGETVRRRWMPTITRIISQGVKTRDGCVSTGPRASCCG